MAFINQLLAESRSLVGMVALFVAPGQIAADRLAAISGLQWHYKWQESLPQVDKIQCEGMRNEHNEFLRCDPGGVVLYFWWDSTGDKIVRSIVRPAVAPYADELRAASGVFGSGALTAAVKLSIERQEIDGRPRDEGLTESFFDRSRTDAEFLGKQIAKTMPDERFAILFPWVASSEPEYNVYLTKGGEVYLIWSYQVSNSQIAKMPGFTYDIYHKNIYPAASRNLSQIDRWYRTVELH